MVEKILENDTINNKAENDSLLASGSLSLRCWTSGSLTYAKQNIHKSHHYINMAHHKGLNKIPYIKDPVRARPRSFSHARPKLGKWPEGSKKKSWKSNIDGSFCIWRKNKITDFLSVPSMKDSFSFKTRTWMMNGAHATVWSANCNLVTQKNRQETERLVKHLFAGELKCFCWERPGPPENLGLINLTCTGDQLEAPRPTAFKSHQEMGPFYKRDASLILSPWVSPRNNVAIKRVLQCELRGLITGNCRCTESWCYRWRCMLHSPRFGQGRQQRPHAVRVFDGNLS